MDWTADKVRAAVEDLRRYGDDFVSVEAKRADGGLPENLSETVCAFANMPGGGVILLGVDQHDGFAISGVRQPNVLAQGLVDKTRATVDPAPHVVTSSVEIDGVSVVVAEVRPVHPSLRPAAVDGVAYLRQGDGDYQMNANELRLLEIDKLLFSEQVPGELRPVAGTSREDLDDELTGAYLGSIRRHSRRLGALSSDDDLLRTVGVLTKDGELTVAGLYGLGYYPQGRLPSLSVTAAVRLDRGRGPARTRNLTHFEGPVPQMLTDVVDWIAANTGTEQAYREDGHMEQRPEFPGRAIRELVANALVHRDLGPAYLDEPGRHVDVRVHNDRMVITSPGGLRGVSVEQLESAEVHTAEVNQRLYQLMKYAVTPDGSRVVEGEGGGIREMFDSVREAGLARPRLFDNGVKFTVMLPRKRRFTADDEKALERRFPGTDLSAIQKTVILAGDAGETWTPERVVEEFSPLDRESARREIEWLREHGYLETASTPLSPANDRDTGPSSNFPQEQSAGPDEQPVPSSTGRGIDRIPTNQQLVMEALVAGPLNFAGIVDGTGLTQGQARYAVNKLIEAEAIEMVGGQGSRRTFYRVKPES